MWGDGGGVGGDSVTEQDGVLCCVVCGAGPDILAAISRGRLRWPGENNY